MTEHLYRYSLNYDHITLEKYRVVRKTPKGKWIELYAWPTDRHSRRFVLDDGTKRFAWETKELALESFRRRTERRISILQAQVKLCQDALARVKEAETPEQLRAQGSRWEFDL
jgi:hypothetical protein